jgi:hypothetical protein
MRNHRRKKVVDIWSPHGVRLRLPRGFPRAPRNTGGWRPAWRAAGTRGGAMASRRAPPPGPRPRALYDRPAGRRPPGRAPPRGTPAPGPPRPKPRPQASRPGGGGARPSRRRAPGPPCTPVVQCELPRTPLAPARARARRLPYQLRPRGAPATTSKRDTDPIASPRSRRPTSTRAWAAVLRSLEPAS